MKTINFKGIRKELGYSIMGSDHAWIRSPLKGDISLKDILNSEVSYMVPNYKDGKWEMADLSAIGEVTIVTHNGTFHSDELLGVMSLIKKLKKYNIKSKIIRTRDPRVIKDADIVLDVGSIYDVDNLRFDHHQNKELECSYSLLIKNKIGERISFADEKRIDEGDRGIADHSDYPLIRFIKSQNSLDLTENDERFVETIETIEMVIKESNSSMKVEEELDKLAKINEKKIEEKKKNFLDSIKGLQPDSDGVIVFDKNDEFLPFWKKELNGLAKPELKWIVFWDKLQNCWTIQVVPTDPNNPIEFPKENSLALLKDSSSTIFVHNAGFLAKVKDWKKAIKQLNRPTLVDL
jgi:uncharacterized UPF0160 family protein